LLLGDRGLIPDAKTQLDQSPLNRNFDKKKKKDTDSSDEKHGCDFSIRFFTFSRGSRFDGIALKRDATWIFLIG